MLISNPPGPSFGPSYFLDLFCMSPSGLRHYDNTGLITARRPDLHADFATQFIAYIAFAILRVCHVVVGTPGRLCALLERGDLVSPSLKLLVLDDPERLLGETFWSDISWMHSVCPESMQVHQFLPPFSPAGAATVEKHTRTYI